jgi:hypothetical protein
MGKGKKKSLRKAMKNRGGFLRRGPEKPRTAPGEIKTPKPGWLRAGKAKKLKKPKPPKEDGK